MRSNCEITTSRLVYNAIEVPEEDVDAIKATIREDRGINLDYYGFGHTSILVNEIEEFNYWESDGDK